MAIVCKSCNKDLYKDDGSGPYCCPSCVNRRIEAVDSTTGELVQLNVSKGRKSITPKSHGSVHMGLLKDTRYAVTVPQRPDFVKMLRLKSRRYKNTTIPLGPVYARFDQNGVAEIAEHQKQFIDPILVARPNQFEWLETAAEHLVSTLTSLNEFRRVEPEVEVEVDVEVDVPEKVVEAIAVAEEAMAVRADLKKAKKKKTPKKVEE